jgi:hypothetical protein
MGRSAVLGTATRAWISLSPCEAGLPPRVRRGRSGGAGAERGRNHTLLCSRRPEAIPETENGRLTGRDASFRRSGDCAREGGGGCRRAAPTVGAPYDAVTLTLSYSIGELASKPMAPWLEELSVTVMIGTPSRLTLKVEPTAVMER